jgi:UDP-N-acetylmuramate dehydrogenase
MLERGRELKHFCTLGIGGPAKYFIEAREMSDLTEAIAFANANSLEVFVMGKGSNCLFDERGFDGLVIYNNIQNITFFDGGVFVSGGYSFARLGLSTSRRGLSGLEFAAGIPGSVGGAVYMNAGAMGSEVSDVLIESHWIDQQGQLHISKREDLDFSYRHSGFQEDGGLIIGARFALQVDETAKERCQTFLQKRLLSQPYSEKTAGCFFRNPKGGCAGAWIDGLGLKGLSVGGAAVSSLHANFIINRGGATSGDVLQLIEKIQIEVEKAFGERLILEVRLVPYRSLHVSG